MVLDDAASEDDHARPPCPDRNGVDVPNILDEIDPELPRRGLERVEVEHVSKAPVRQRWAEDWDVVLVGPVVHRPLVVDLLAEPVYDLRRRPAGLVLRTLARLLLLQHLVQDRHHPVLEGAVVGIGHHQVPYAVEALRPELSARRMERGHVGVPETLDEILLDTPCCRNDARHMLMLHQIAEDAPESRRDHVGRIAKEDGGLVTSLGIAPCSL